MTGIHADWFTEPQKVRMVVVCTFAVALAVRALAGFLVQRLLQINRRNRNVGYRIPLTLVHRKRSKAGGTAAAVPIPGGEQRGAAVNRRAL